MPLKIGYSPFSGKCEFGQYINLGGAVLVAAAALKQIVNIMARECQGWRKRSNVSQSSLGTTFTRKLSLPKCIQCVTLRLRRCEEVLKQRIRVCTSHRSASKAGCAKGDFTALVWQCRGI